MLWLLTFTCISRDVLPCALTAVTRNLRLRPNMVWSMMTSSVCDNTALPRPMSVHVNVDRGREVDTAQILSPTKQTFFRGTTFKSGLVPTTFTCDNQCTKLPQEQSTGKVRKLNQATDFTGHYSFQQEIVFSGKHLYMLQIYSFTNFRHFTQPDTFFTQPSEVIQGGRNHTALASKCQLKGSTPDSVDYSPSTGGTLTHQQLPQSTQLNFHRTHPHTVAPSLHHIHTAAPSVYLTSTAPHCTQPHIHSIQLHQTPTSQHPHCTQPTSIVPHCTQPPHHSTLTVPNPHPQYPTAPNPHIIAPSLYPTHIHSTPLHPTLHIHSTPLHPTPTSQHPH